MEITRGSLDDISRPASSEPTGSRVSSVSLPHRDRICPTAPLSLLVLSNADAADLQVSKQYISIVKTLQLSSFPEVTPLCNKTTLPLPDDCHTVATEDEDEDSKLQRAIWEMRRLDEILSAKICREKEIQRQRKELQAKLWQELQVDAVSVSILFTKLIQELLLVTSASRGPCDRTRIHICQVTPQTTFYHMLSDGMVIIRALTYFFNICLQPYNVYLYLTGEKKPDSLTDSSEVGYKDKAEDQFEGSHCGASKGMNKQKDFVKRNIEVCQSSRRAERSAGMYRMTWSESLSCLFFQSGKYLSVV
uniref:Fibrous sheath-interacting protein 1 n=1 Tax=Stegastes partitus TaxID=144197 RepID=A0A3B5BBP8_9TELE